MSSKKILRRIARSRVRTDKKIAAAGELRHWLDQGSDRVIWVPYGYEGFKHRFIPQFDVISGQPWVAYYDRVLSDTPKKTSRLSRDGKKIQIKELRYTLDQYELIRWACWRMENGWTAREVYEIMIHSRNELRWATFPGQTPLTARKIITWRRHRRNMMSRGWIWP